MKLTKKNIYSFVGRRCSHRFSIHAYRIVGLNSKGRVLLLRDGKEDAVINRKPVYISDIRLMN